MNNTKNPTYKDLQKSRCFMCENYDKEKDECKEYEYKECSKINFTRCEGFIVKEKLYNF